MYWTELTRIECITIQLYGFEESVRIEVWDSAPNQPLLPEETESPVKPPASGSTMLTPCPCDLARDCHAAYPAAEPHLRRLFNQAFFTHLYIDDDGVRHDYAEPFDTLLGDDVLDAGRAIQADPGAGQITMADLLGGEDPRPAPTARPRGHFVPLGVLLLGLRHLFTVSKVRIGLVWCPWQDSNLRPSDQKAASGMSIRVLSVASMMARRAVSSGRMLRAKKPAAATLPW
jgi:hypothetical protein